MFAPQPVTMRSISAASMAAVGPEYSSPERTRPRRVTGASVPASMMRLPETLRGRTASTAKHDDVLFGKDLDRLIELQTLGFDFGADLFERHLVLGTYRDLRIFAAVFEEHEASAGLEGGAHVIEP